MSETIDIAKVRQLREMIHTLGQFLTSMEFHKIMVVLAEAVERMEREGGA